MKYKNLDKIEAWINDNLYYDPEFGIFINTKSNKILNNIDFHGYTRIHINTNGINTSIKLHRVAWFLYYGKWPEKCIDHINGDRSDNRIENLRDVSHSENSLNKDKHRNGHIKLFCKTPYVSKKGLYKFTVQFPTSKNTNGHRNIFRYTCALQAEMASCMIISGEFNPEIHNERVVNHLNSHGKLLKRNLSFCKTKNAYVVNLEGKQMYQNSCYDKALSVWESIYG